MVATSQEQTFQKTNNVAEVRINVHQPADGEEHVSPVIGQVKNLTPPTQRGQDWEGDRKPGPNWPDAIRTQESDDLRVDTTACVVAGIHQSHKNRTHESQA